MCAWIIPPIADLSEPVPAPEYTVLRTGAVERIGNWARFYLYNFQMLVDAPRQAQVPVVVVKILRPLDGVNFGTGCVRLEELTRGTPPPGRFPRLVR